MLVGVLPNGDFLAAVVIGTKIELTAPSASFHLPNVIQSIIGPNIKDLQSVIYVFPHGDLQRLVIRRSQRGPGGPSCSRLNLLLMVKNILRVGEKHFERTVEVC